MQKVIQPIQPIQPLIIKIFKTLKINKLVKNERLYRVEKRLYNGCINTTNVPTLIRVFFTLCLVVYGCVAGCIFIQPPF